MAGSAIHLESKQWTKQVFNSSGTFNVPSGIDTVFVELIGGGGSGASGAATSDTLITDGRAGDYIFTAVDVTPGASVSVVVGIGGTGVSSGAGNPGGNSIFFGDTTITARGGLGGRVVSFVNYGGNIGTGLIELLQDLGYETDIGLGATGGAGAGSPAAANPFSSLAGSDGRVVVWYKNY